MTLKESSRVALTLVICTLARVAFADTKLEFSRETLPASAPQTSYGAGYALDSKRNRMLVYGRSFGTSGGHHNASSLLAFNLNDDSWTQLTMEGESPSTNDKPGLAYVAGEDALYLFGGKGQGNMTPSDELWRLDLSSGPSLTWEKLDISGDRPRPRSSMVFVADEERGRLIVHGGDAGAEPPFEFTPLADLWEFDLKKREWGRLFKEGDAPERRSNHAAALDPKSARLYVFGGAGFHVTYTVKRLKDKDLYFLDLKTDTWSKLPRNKRSPRPVQGTTLTFDAEANALVVVGGLANDSQGPAGIRRVYSYDLQRKTWARSKAILDQERSEHSGVYDPVNRRHIIFGGQSIVEEGNTYRLSESISDTISVTIRRVSTR